MSYILDALKKIEHEKNRKKLPDGRVNISGDLFQERNRQVSKTRSWKVLVLVAVVSLIACAGTWFALKGNGSKGKSASKSVVPAQSPRPVASPQPPAVPVQPQPSPVVSPISPPAPSINSKKVADEDIPARADRRSKKQLKAPPVINKQPVQTAQVPADIKLSGIAWQDERSARRAVINGFLLKEGAVVSGAKIIDIKADRVRFSSVSGSFEIKLDSVLPAETKR